MAGAKRKNTSIGKGNGKNIAFDEISDLDNEKVDQSKKSKLGKSTKKSPKKISKLAKKGKRGKAGTTSMTKFVEDDNEVVVMVDTTEFNSNGKLERSLNLSSASKNNNATSFGKGMARISDAAKNYTEEGEASMHEDEDVIQEGNSPEVNKGIRQETVVEPHFERTPSHCDQTREVKKISNEELIDQAVSKTFEKLANFMQEKGFIPGNENNDKPVKNQAQSQPMGKEARGTIHTDQQQVREDRDRGGCDQEDHHLDHNRRERQDRQDRYYEERPRSGGSRPPEEHRRGGEERERQPNARD